MEIFQNSSFLGIILYFIKRKIARENNRTTGKNTLRNGKLSQTEGFFWKILGGAVHSRRTPCVYDIRGSS
jgi:hypothetical protein